MFDKLLELIKDSAFMSRLVGARSEDEAAQLVVSEGATKGFVFTLKEAMDALSKLAHPGSGELSEEELLGVAGGMRSMMSGVGSECGTAYGPNCPTKFMCPTAHSDCNSKDCKPAE